MKTKIALSILILTSFYSFSQVSKPKNMRFVPMGTVVLKEDIGDREETVNAFWMSEQITNREYREFIDALKNSPNDSIVIIDYRKYKETNDKEKSTKRHSYREVLELALDTSVWDSNEKYQNYFDDKKFDDYPVVGVSHISAVFYCAWRTKMENKTNRKKGLPFAVENRLPSEAEWEYVAANTSHVNTKVIAKVKSGKKNKYGLHNLNGNVSEWTSSSAPNGDRIIKGTSWKTDRQLKDRFVVQPDFRDNATGFRLVKTYVGRK